MNKNCMIKSHPKGISIVLDASVGFEELIVDICNAFYEAGQYFGERSMVLSIEGRNLTNEEIAVVVEAIELNSQVKIPYVIENEEAKDVRVLKAMDRYFFEKAAENAKIIRGNVNSGEIVSSDTGILVIGDVKPGAKLRADGNIVVMGTLGGAVRAGEPDDTGACIVANHLDIKTATIGGISGEINVKIRGGFFTRGNPKEPMVIKLLNGYFHTEPLSSGLAKQDK